MCYVVNDMVDFKYEFFIGDHDQHIGRTSEGDSQIVNDNPT